ncbi:MAG: hypothetical protein JXR76_26495 [Deltaproteobacteria bacterium]|nr:hypothetical protein [Deltaproteobacteria bacterium]
MTKELIVENDFYSIWYHPDSKIVHNQFHQYTYGDKFRNCLNDGLKVLEEKHAVKWLSDDRKNSAIPVADREWTMQNWVPRIAKMGWKYWAIIVPKSVIGKMNLEWFAGEIGIKDLTIKMFSEIEDGMNWIIDPQK